MSVSYIPEKTKLLLWGKAAGRCEYDGCNESLWLDSVTKFEFNTAYIAHIIADKPGGPRGDATLSDKLKDDLSNLMLLCDKHHRLIDKERVKEHPVEKLREMKERQEKRIELLTSIIDNKKSHVLLYGANIGNHNSSVSWTKTVPAMLPHWYPAGNHAIELSLKNSSFVDHESEYWRIERENLHRHFEQKVKPILTTGEIIHISVFAHAPQPLLIELGHLLSDIQAAQVYQLHREPPNWIWQDDVPPLNFQVLPPKRTGYKKVALNLSLSATITSERITEVIGEDTSIWTLTIDNPNNDFLKSRDHLSEFRQVFRKLLNEIKVNHGQDNLLHVFSAVPVSVAVEIGRTRMPKADLPLRIYDQNNGIGGFTFALEID